MENRFHVGVCVLVSGILLAGACAISRAQATAPSTRPATTAPAVTPTEIPGTEAFVYRDGKPDPMRLFVAKPPDWKSGDRRPAFVFFFGGGFLRGTPERSIGTAKSLNKLGFVAIAPDYRTPERFPGATPAECIADARAAVRWVQDHADELGIDPARIVVGGSSAGGSLALWTAITHTPPGSSESEAPRFKPAALVLFSAPTDTANSKRAKLFGKYAIELSPLQNLDEKMPPTLAFHGDADTTVTYEDGVKLRDKLQAGGNDITFVTVPGGTHGFRTDMPDWKVKSGEMLVEFLQAHGLVDGRR